MPHTAVETVQLYELLKPRLGEQESRSLLGFIEERTIHLVQDEIAKGLVTRHDLNSVRDELSQDIAAVRQEVVAVRQELSQDIAGVRQELAEVKQDLSEVHKEIAHLDQRITTEIARLDQRITTEIARLDQRITTESARLEKGVLAFQWQTRLYFVIIALLILFTNPGVLDLVSRLLGLPRP